MKLKMNKRDALTFIFSFILLGITIFTASMVQNGKEPGLKKDSQESAQVFKSGASSEGSIVETGSAQNEEMRAVWISRIDLQVDGEFTESKFKENYVNILEEAKHVNLNTVIVQVRSFSDALYPSKVYPWSHTLTGTQGVDPGFDPLAFMIEQAHIRGLKFQAWIVPMRIKSGTTPRTFCESNPCLRFKEKGTRESRHYVVEADEMTYFDPEYPEVRDMIVEGVCEVVRDYDVDGISFDDYFYPENNFWVDEKSYAMQEKYADNQVCSFVVNRRKRNINLLVSEVYRAIKEIKSDVIFGICPHGNVDNAHRAGADVELWGSTEGYVDYLCPEIYTNSTHPFLPFDKAVPTWRKIVTCSKVKFYVGLGLYKAGTDKYDQGTWSQSDSIIMGQIKCLRKNEADGFAIFSGAYLKKSETEAEVLNAMKVINQAE